MSAPGATLDTPRGRARRAPTQRNPQERTMPSLNPYLSFKNQARDAMAFYQSVFGGELTLSTFGEYPDMPQDPAEKDLVMHAQLDTPDGFVLMGSDTPSGMEYVEPVGVSVSVSGDDEAQLTGFWSSLADGGTITMPFEVPPWGGRFGMLRDKFGIDWMIAYSPAS
jgi:PhnB protein